MLLLTGLSACALSPQTVALRPYIDVRAEPIGRGRGLDLSVADARPGPELGRRGGVYDTAAITPRNDVAQAIQVALSERLEASGFVTGPPAPPGAADAGFPGAAPGAGPVMRVTLRELSYEVSSTPATGGPLLREVRLRAVVAAEVLNAGARRSGEYQASGAVRRLGYPGSAENEELINEVLAQALQRLMQDRNLLDLLAL